MQNEELLDARAEVEAGLKRYMDLYDFAPVGYFTFGRDGEIQQVNLAGARLLGVERSRLVGRRFGLCVSEADRPAFNAFLKTAFESRANAACEVALLKEGASPLVVRIEAAASEDGQECRAVVADITDRKRAEEAVKKYSHDLNERVKELNCLYLISETVRRNDISQGELLQESLHILAQAYAYPEITACRITWGDHEYSTENFRKTTWSQDRAIVVHGEQVGTIEVCYLEERRRKMRGPFLPKNAHFSMPLRIFWEIRGTQAGRGGAKKELEQFFGVWWTCSASPTSNGFFRRLSAAWERTLGYTCNELMASRFLDFVHPG